MSPSENKKKKQSPTPTLQWNSLPDDLLLSCFAHVPRSYYLTLSLVSKRFRSLIASPELYKARSLLGCTESCLYVCINLFSVRDMWFTLYRNPHKTPSRKENEPNEYFLAKVPMANSPPADYRGHGLVAVGSSIYNICGSSSDNVFVLDCATHTWSEAPSFRGKLATITASVVSKKIYVAGCSKHDDPTSSIIEVLDTETQIWDALSIPWSQIESKFIYKSTCINGKFNLQMHSGSDIYVAAYNSKEGRWDLGEPVSMSYPMPSDNFCVIANVLYAVHGVVAWYDTKASTWRLLKGLEGLPNFNGNANVRLADYGGKMAVLWEEDFHYRGKIREKRIWCAEIVLERRENCEMWGTVEWFGHVLSVPDLCSIVKLVAVTV